MRILSISVASFSLCQLPGQPHPGGGGGGRLQEPHGPAQRTTLGRRREQVSQLKLIGRGQGPDGPIEVEATRELVFAKQSILPTSTLTQRGVAAAPALPTAVTFEAPSQPIEIAHGFGGTIPITVVRAKGGDAALQITPLLLPPGLAVPAASIAGKSALATVAVNTTLEASSLGTMTIALQAKGKFAGGEQTIAIPAVR